MLTLSERTPYPDIDPAPPLRGCHWARPPVAAFEAATPAEARTVHEAVRAALAAAGCTDWLSGDPEPNVYTRHMFWSDGTCPPPAVETRRVELREYKLVPVFVRTAVWRVPSGRLRGATYAVRAWSRPFAQAEALPLPHIRALGYLERYQTAVQPGWDGDPYHRLPLKHDPHRRDGGLFGTAVDPKVHRLLECLDHVPYDLADGVLRNDDDAWLGFGEAPFPTPELKRTAERLAEEAIQENLLAVSRGVG